jgi:chromosome segregation ATPase
MQSSSDPSLLRRLALAFGEGLVFSVGMKLMNDDGVRPRIAPVAAGTGPDFAPLADRLGRIEKRLKESDAHRQAAAPAAPAAAAIPASGMDQKVIIAIVGAVEKHLEAHALKVQKRIDGLQAAVTASADAAAAKRIEKEAAALRQDVLTMQREMLTSLGQIVAAQGTAEVAQQTAALQASMQQSVDAAVAPLRTEVRDLRRHLSETDDTMAEFVSAITDTVRRTSETLPAAARADGEWRGAGRVDLKTLRRRLSDMDKRPAEPRLLPIPAAAATQRRGPVPVREFPVAS